jgi:hypothetical protein
MRTGRFFRACGGMIAQTAPPRNRGRLPHQIALSIRAPATLCTPPAQIDHRFLCPMGHSLLKSASRHDSVFTPSASLITLT